MQHLSAIDLFCGAGGLSTGFQQSGFSVLVGNDSDEVSGQTFAGSHPGAVFISDQVQNVSVKILLKESGLARGELDCLIGGPPCQGFSVYNHQRGMHDVRSHLFKEYLRIVDGLRPKWIVMENVTGLLSIEKGAVIRQICDSLNHLGYRVEWRILKAEEYGVPQERRRMVLIGTRTESDVAFPKQTHGSGKLPFVDIEEAIGDLPALRNGEAKLNCLYPTKPKSSYQTNLRARSALIQNHQAPKLSAINIERMKHIPAGGSWRDIPFDLLPEGMKRAKRSDHTKRYGRMQNKGLACTILTKCDIHWGAYIHPEQERAISVREAARLQSFPDNFYFEGSMTDQYVQIGNAVPPILARRIAESIVTKLNGEIEVRNFKPKNVAMSHADL
jgi:DNA (cytosine-5)-methyltransferase 1